MGDLYQPVYKCRMCGKKFTVKANMPERDIVRAIVSENENKYLDYERLHAHNENSFGIADLIGFARGETS